MPATSPYIPRAQSKFDLWAQNFSRQVGEAPERFLLTPADAQAIAAAVGTWNEAYRSTTCKRTRNQCAVAAKNVARTEALSALREYAQQVANARGVDEGAKLVLGVNPGKNKRERIKPPASWPVLAVVRADYLQLTIGYSDSLAVKKAQAKPYGVGSCQIFYSLSAERITRQGDLSEQITATRSPYVLNFPHSAGGQQCYLAGYWLLRNGKRGRWGPILSFTVPRGG